MTSRPTRWCEHDGCERLAVVLVSDLEGFQAFVCRDHWHHLHRTTGGAVRAVRVLTTNWHTWRSEQEDPS